MAQKPCLGNLGDQQEGACMVLHSRTYMKGWNTQDKVRTAGSITTYWVLFSIDVYWSCSLYHVCLCVCECTVSGVKQEENEIRVAALESEAFVCSHNSELGKLSSGIITIITHPPQSHLAGASHVLLTLAQARHQKRKKKESRFQTTANKHGCKNKFILVWVQEAGCLFITWAGPISTCAAGLQRIRHKESPQNR